MFSVSLYSRHITAEHYFHYGDVCKNVTSIDIWRFLWIMISAHCLYQGIEIWLRFHNGAKKYNRNNNIHDSVKTANLLDSFKVKLNTHFSVLVALWCVTAFLSWHTLTDCAWSNRGLDKLMHSNSPLLLSSSLPCKPLFHVYHKYKGSVAMSSYLL